MKRPTLRAMTLVSALLALSGCPSNAVDAGSDTSQPSGGDTGGGGGGDSGGGGGGDVVADTGTPDAGGGGGGSDVKPGEARWTQPDGTAALAFWIDDSANKTYADEEMQWTGSFAWSDKDNTIAYATSWLPTDGPYPFLYDDGPISQGGHEMEGAVAGDSIFSTEVWLKADEDTSIEYGALNELGNWIWIGSNGVVDVPAGSTDRYELPGMTIPPFGPVNMKVTLDANALQADFAGTPPQGVFLKGSMNSWTGIQLLDDGAAGDDVAGDGVYTYIHLDKLGPHDGGLRLGQEVQFVFVIGYAEGGTADEGIEYKVGGDAAPEGVAVWSDWETAGTWTAEELVLKVDSKGKTLNTAIIVGDDENLPTGCISDAECPGQVCEKATGECVDETPTGCTSDADCPGQVCDLGTGDCVDETPTSCTSDADCPGQVCDLGSGECVPGGEVSKPIIQIVDPDNGSTAGGTAVSISGSDFQDGAKVWFGASEASGVTVTGATTIDCTTPAGSAGKVDVKVTNPDGGTVTLPKGFEYLDAAAAPSIGSIEPNTGSVKGGTLVTVSGSGFTSGSIVTFDGKQATDVSLAGGSLSLKTPAHAAGVVDVKVTNPNGQSDTKAGAFTYVPDLPDWVGLLEPLTVAAFEGQATATLKGQLYEAGITDAPGEGSGVTAEIGYGPKGSDPYAAASGWKWTPADYDGDMGNNDVWSGTLTVATAGTYAWAMRFTVNGGESWLVADGDGAQSVGEFSPAAAGTLTVKAVPTTPTVLAMSPRVASVVGGTTITLSGVKLSGATAVLVDGASVTPDNVTDTAITFTAPAHADGLVEVSATVGGNGVDVPDSLAYGLLHTPTLDGFVTADWPAAVQLAENTVESDWTAANSLQTLWASFDGANLYIAVAGTVEETNSIVAYVDTDFGDGTGAANMSMLTDEDGGLDACFSGGLNVTAPGFGAEYGAGTIGKSWISAGEGLSGEAGWRLLSPSDNFGWVVGDMITGTNAVEMSVPLATLFPTGIPASGVKVGIVVRITYYGNAYPNQSLPMGVAGEGSTQQTAVAVLTVYGS